MWIVVDDLGTLINKLERIASALETIVDFDKRTLRMEDVERAKVYSEHLGKKLSS